MQFRRRKQAGLILVIGLILSLAATAAMAAPATRPATPEGGIEGRNFSDNLKGPLTVRQNQLRQQALEARLNGTATAPVVQVARGKYVELSRERTDKVFVIIAEFGNTRHAAYPDTNPDGTPASDALTFDGPVHNRFRSPIARWIIQLCGCPTTTKPIIPTCISTAWRSTGNRSRRAATR